MKTNRTPHPRGTPKKVPAIRLERSNIIGVHFPCAVCGEDLDFLDTHNFHLKGKPYGAFVCERCGRKHAPRAVVAELKRRRAAETDAFFASLGTEVKP